MLRVIALFRLATATALIIAGIGALQLLRPAVAERVRDWLTSLPFATGRVPTLTPVHIELAAAAAFAYAALFITEGVGLWLGRAWAEWLTILATSSLIPFELWEVIKKTTAIRLSGLIANVAIVIYLVARRIRARR